MKPLSPLTTGLFVIAMTALLLSPSAAADCVSECTSSKLSGCASGAGSGAGSAGGAGVACAYNVNIAITVYGDIYQCTAIVYSEASSCEGDEGDGDRDPREDVIEWADPVQWG